MTSATLTDYWPRLDSLSIRRRRMLCQYLEGRTTDTDDDESIAAYIEEGKQRAENEAHGIEGA